MSARIDPQPWIELAEKDWEAIQTLLAAAEPHYSLICNLAQQSAEKYLKAFLIQQGVEPLRTHDLVALITECDKFATGLGALKNEGLRLTAEAVAPRYPTRPSRDRADAKAAVAAAERIRAAIRERLGL